MLLYVHVCQHGNTLSVIAVPEDAEFTDPACRRKDGQMRPHTATKRYYREAVEEDFYVRKVPRKTRRDKGMNRGPKKPRDLTKEHDALC